MTKYPAPTFNGRGQAEGQLQLIASAYRKQAGIKHADAAKQFGVTQQTMSLLEKNINKASFERVVVLRKRTAAWGK